MIIPSPRLLLLSSTLLLVLAPPLCFSGNWNMAIGDGGGSTQEAMGIKFAELLERATDGEITTRLFVNGQLGSEQATVVDVSLGTLDLAVVGSNNLSAFSPSLSILSLPYIFENLEQTVRFVNSSFADELVEQTRRDANVRILAWAYSGFRMLTNSKGPITALDNLKGLVVRVPKNEIMINTYRAWGINPTPLAWSETFTALQQRVVDGQDSPYIAIYSMKFGEIQPYLTEIHYMFQLEPLIIAEELFQKQSPEQQALLISLGEQASAYSLNWLRSREATIKADIVATYGIRIDTLSDEREWAETARSTVWPEYYDYVGGQDKIERLLKSIQSTRD